MRQYRLQLGQRGCHIGGIDTQTGVTLQLIELIIQKCEHIKSASDMFTNFEIWDMQHALSLYKIISDVCDH